MVGISHYQGRRWSRVFRECEDKASGKLESDSEVEDEAREAGGATIGDVPRGSPAVRAQDVEDRVPWKKRWISAEGTL